MCDLIIVVVLIHCLDYLTQCKDEQKRKQDL